MSTICAVIRIIVEGLTLQVIAGVTAYEARTTLANTQPKRAQAIESGASATERATDTAAPFGKIGSVASCYAGVLPFKHVMVC